MNSMINRDATRYNFEYQEPITLGLLNTVRKNSGVTIKRIENMVLIGHS